MNDAQILGEYLALGADGYFCLRCGHRYCECDSQWKSHARCRETACDEDAIGASITPRADGAVVFRQFFCPGCLTEVDSEVALQGEPLRQSFTPLDIG